MDTHTSLSSLPLSKNDQIKLATVNRSSSLDDRCSCDMTVFVPSLLNYLSPAGGCAIISAAGRRVWTHTFSRLLISSLLLPSFHLVSVCTQLVLHHC